MKSFHAVRPMLASRRRPLIVPFALLACCATACGGGSKTKGGETPSPDASGTYGGSGGGSSSGGYIVGGSSGGSESEAGEDSGSDGSGEDGSASSSGGAEEGGSDATTGSSSGASDGGSSSGSSGADGGSSGSSGSSGADGGSSSGADGGSSGADGGSSSSGADGGSSSGTDGGSSSGTDSGSSSGTDSGGSSGGSSSSGGADAAAETGTTCNLSGAWALKVTVQVTWSTTEILAAGSGTVNLWALVQGTQSGASFPVTVLPCGIALPDFNGPSIVGSPTFGVTFPDSLFDGTFLTATSSSLTLSSSSPGASFSSPAEANLIGIAFTNPVEDDVTGAWPSLATAQGESLDTDMDTNPGVTADSKVGQRTEDDAGTYSAIPVGALGPDADKLYMALRSVVALGGTLTTCTTASGPATVSQINDHTVGCHLVAGGNCSTAGGALSQAAFVDTNSPAFVVSSATFQAQLLAGSATCPNVRAGVP